VLERLEAALVGRQLAGVRATGSEHAADDDQRDADTGGHDQEQQGRQVLGQHVRFSLASALERAWVGKGRPLARPPLACPAAAWPRTFANAPRGTGRFPAARLCIAAEL